MAGSVSWIPLKLQKQKPDKKQHKHLEQHQASITFLKENEQG